MRKIFNVLELGKDKKQIGWVLLLTVFMTVVETVGISLMMPFIQIAMDFKVIHENEYYEAIYKFFLFNSEKSFVLYFGGFLLVFFLFRTIYTVFYKYMLSKYSKKLYRATVEKLFSNFVSLSYREFIERNSSRMAQILTQEAQNSEMLIRTLITSIGDILTIVVVYGLLLVLDWKITIAFTIILSINVYLLSLTVTPVIKNKGHERTEVFRYLYRMIYETFGNFKMLKLRAAEDKSKKSFSLIMGKLIRLMITNEILSQIPKLILEMIGFSLIVGIVMYWIIEYDSDISSFMGILSVFFFAMYRLMPSFNRVISSINQLAFIKKSLEIVRDNLLFDTEKLGKESIDFAKKIELKNLSFEYTLNKPVLKNINLSIQKGEHVAFIGPSGSGKSTIVDIIIGLYQASDGEICIDDIHLGSPNVRSWREKIGYIPQDIYLFDSTVAENVALEDMETLDEQKVIEALKKAHIYDFLQEHQEGILTIVGEKGVKLSGGQKQRIAIARALYHDPEVLVLDEATSALDTATEKEIMKNLYQAGQGKTLLIIAHRISTIQECDTVYTLENGKIVDMKKTVK